jgi:KRAB domain-containing zinc finger protein
MCGKTVKMFNLTDHQKIHKGEKSCECGECGRAFLRKSQLAEHQKTHTGDKSYVCSECGKGFARKLLLIAHE